MNPESVGSSSANSRIIGKFVTEWRNKSLLKKINGAKSTIDSKPFVCVKSTRMSELRSTQQRIDQNNSILGRKLSDIYGRKSQY